MYYVEKTGEETLTRPLALLFLYKWTYSRILRYVGRNVFSSSHPLPFLVQQHPPVHLLRRAVKEVGAALALAHLDVVVNVVTAFSLHAEHLVAVGSYLFQRASPPFIQPISLMP